MRAAASGVVKALVATLVLTAGLAAPSPARGEDILVIFDTSGSMGTGGEIQPAKDALVRTLDEIETPGARWGLREYGSGCCQPDTRLVVPIADDGLEEIRERVEAFEGTGISPMPEALRAARTAELATSGSWRQQVIVVSDGLVERDAACREARALREEGVRVTMIGLEFAQVPEGQETLRYVAEHPDCAFGRYIRAERPDLVALALRRTAAAFHALPYRVMGWLLALVAGYATTRFLEIVLERRTDLPRRAIPLLCRASFLLLAVASAGLFLGGATPGPLAARVAVLALVASGLYFGVAYLRGAAR